MPSLDTPTQRATAGFITLEGIDGCGKSTQARLLAAALEHAGKDVLRLREPGGAKISEKIRALLLDPANAEMGETCELLLFEAARAQLVEQIIAPALAAGQTVVCDRFFDSTTAYQSYAGGQDLARVRQANALAVGECVPALTLVFDLTVEQALARRAARAGEDRMELKGDAYQERVAAGFRAIAAAEPERVKLIDAAGTVAEVFSQVVACVCAAGIELSEADVQAALAADAAETSEVTPR